MLSLAEAAAVQEEWPGWRSPWQDGTTGPPQADWFAVLELAGDLGCTFFDVALLPREEPFVGLALTWANIRRQALALLADFRAAQRQQRTP